MGTYDDIGIPIKGQPISSGAYGVKVRNAILDLDRRMSSVDTTSNTGKAFATTNLLLTSGTEVAALTISNMTFKAGLAYEATMMMGLQTTLTAIAANSPPFISARVRKFNATPGSGDDWGLYHRFSPLPVGTNTASIPASCYASIFLLNNTAADITSSVNFNVAAASAAFSNTSIVGNSSTPRYFIISPAGFAADFVGLGIQVT